MQNQSKNANFGLKIKEKQILATKNTEISLKSELSHPCNKSICKLLYSQCFICHCTIEQKNTVSAGEFLGSTVFMEIQSIVCPYTSMFSRPVAKGNPVTQLPYGYSKLHELILKHTRRHSSQTDLHSTSYLRSSCGYEFHALYSSKFIY